MPTLSILPNDWQRATLIGRVWRPELNGPSVIVVRDQMVFDITSPETPTVSDLLERGDRLEIARSAQGESLGQLDTFAHATKKQLASRSTLLAPCDLQPIKACGVTFAGSMIERVIEERAQGNASLAEEIRARIADRITTSLKDISPGSQDALRVKQVLISDGLWSQYLEVGLGPDAEVFSKSQPMSSVGWGADVGIHPLSEWNNPEPEIVLAVNSRAEICGAALGNDVNLRDIEGRSALLLGKAKDNNASCSIGPFIRLFDQHFSLDDVRRCEVTITIGGEDGYELRGNCLMSEISRDPTELVAQTIGAHHQYPDGLMLFLGTMFTPSADRGETGAGFTHKQGDEVSIAAAQLGTLINTVRLSTSCPPWSFGMRHLMRNLTQRQLLTA